jgi:hypothetical protein
MNRKLEHLIGLLINVPILGYYRFVVVKIHHEMVDEDVFCRCVINTGKLSA